MEGVFRLIIPQAGDDGVTVKGGDVGWLRVVGGVVADDEDLVVAVGFEQGTGDEEGDDEDG